MEQAPPNLSLHGPAAPVRHRKFPFGRIAFRAELGRLGELGTGSRHHRARPRRQSRRVVIRPARRPAGIAHRPRRPNHASPGHSRRGVCGWRRSTQQVTPLYPAHRAGGSRHDPDVRTHRYAAATPWARHGTDTYSLWTGIGPRVSSRGQPMPCTAIGLKHCSLNEPHNHRTSPQRVTRPASAEILSHTNLRTTGPTRQRRW